MRTSLQPLRIPMTNAYFLRVFCSVCQNLHNSSFARHCIFLSLSSFFLLFPQSFECTFTIHTLSHTYIIYHSLYILPHTLLHTLPRLIPTTTTATRKPLLGLLINIILHLRLTMLIIHKLRAHFRLSNGREERSPFASAGLDPLH